jgi:hypothetical protein
MTRDTARAMTLDTAVAMTRDTAGAMTRDTAMKAEREADKIHIRNEQQLGACMAEELLSLRSTGQGTVQLIPYGTVYGTVPVRYRIGEVIQPYIDGLIAYRYAILYGTGNVR